MTELTVRELGPGDWAHVERLFGPSGACAGCWCMFWRLRDGERYADVKGPDAKRRLRALVKSGGVHAVLAFDGDEPVGWATFGPRLDFPKLAGARTLACDDPERVWSIPCFFVKPRRRGRGIATALLDGALEAMRRHGASTVEGYPVVRVPPGLKKIPAGGAYTGTGPLFRKAGFRTVGERGNRRERMRRELRGRG